LAGEAWRGRARLGQAWQGRRGMARPGVAWRGVARQAGLGMAWRGEAWQGRHGLTIEDGFGSNRSHIPSPLKNQLTRGRSADFSPHRDDSARCGVFL